MKNNRKTCASIAIVLTPIPGPGRKVKVEIFSKAIVTVELVWMFLNGDRREIEDDGGVPMKRLKRSISLSQKNAGQPSSAEVDRVISGLGGVPVYHGATVLALPESLRVMSHYSGLQVSPILVGPTIALLEDVVYIERLNHDLAFGVDPVRCYGFMTTKHRRDRQIQIIDHRMQLSDDNSDMCANALVNAYYNLLGGYDTIYIADKLETL